MKHRLLLISAGLVLAFLAPVKAQTPRYARVISANANLRDTPSIASSSEQEIVEGTIVKVLDQKLPWYVIRAGNLVGWMHGKTFHFIETQNSVLDPSRQVVVPDYGQSDAVPEPPRTPTRATGSSRGYIRGPRGGCYYLSGSGRKVYVDRSLCN